MVDASSRDGKREFREFNSESLSKVLNIARGI